VLARLVPARAGYWWFTDRAYLYDRARDAWIDTGPAMPSSFGVFAVADRDLVAGPKQAAAYDGKVWTLVAFPWSSVRAIAAVDQRLVVIGGVRQVDTRGCYDDSQTGTPCERGGTDNARFGPVAERTR
jgi:hypothetical protein